MVGPVAVFHVGLYSAIAGGVIGTLVALRTGYLLRALHNLAFLGKIRVDGRSSAGRRPDA